MNSTSPMQTAQAGTVTGAVFTLIASAVKHFNIDLPPDAQLSIAVGIVAGAHWLGAQLAAKAAKKAAAPSAV